MSRKPAERPEQEQLTLGLATRKPAGAAEATTNAPAASPSTAPSASTPASTSTSTPASTSTSGSTPASTSTSAAPVQPRVYVVSELLRAVRLTLESRFTEVRVEGEVSGLKRSGNGHVYFALKDAEA